MAQGDKAVYYRALKDAGYTFEKHYRDYKAAELQQIAAEQGLEITPPEPKAPAPPRPDEVAELREQIAGIAGTVKALAELVTAEQRRAEQSPFPSQVPPAPEAKPEPKPKPEPEPKPVLIGGLDPREHAGVQQNAVAEDEVIEIDEHGNRWYQREVNKPGYAKPRGRRILRYEDPGVKIEHIKVGDYVETFEVAGDPKTARPAEVKITLPSYQTGIYQPPNMPFRVHTYQGARGFNMRDVQKYYGGRDLVPSTIKRTYVSTDLCYDIQSTIRTIENEYRERVLRAERGL